VAKVLIIGASRGIGLETVNASLKAGHSVRALARSARRIPVDHPKLEQMPGDALEMTTVKRALAGIDVVTQSLGVSAGPDIILKPTRLFSKATRVLVTAMEEAQIKRLLWKRGGRMRYWEAAMNDTQLPQIGPMRKSPARTVELFDFSIAAEPPAMPAAHGSR